MANETRVVITADTQRAIADLAKVETQFKSLGDSVGTLKDRFGGLAGIGATIAGAFSVGAVIEKFKKQIDVADELNDLSQRVGGSIKDLVSYKLAADQSGTSLEGVATGIKKLSVFMLEHADAMKAAGISTKDSTVAMRQLADLFASIPDGAEKTALAVKLFGKAGYELIPMLNGGSKALEESASKTAKLAAIYEQMAPQADKFNDTMAELSLYSKMGATSMANDMLPALNNITQAMNEAIKEGGKLKALWVGLGGLGAAMFTDEFTAPVQRLKKELSSIDDDIANYNPLSMFGPSMEKLKATRASIQQQLTSAEKSESDAVVTAEKRKKDAREQGVKDLEKNMARIKALIGADKPAGGADPFVSLMKSIRSDLAGRQTDLASLENGGDKATAAQRKYSEFLAQVQNGDLKLTPSQIGQAAIEWDKLLGVDSAVTSLEKLKKVTEEAKKADTVLAEMRLRWSDENAKKTDAMTVMPASQRSLNEDMRKVGEEGARAIKELAKMQDLSPEVYAEKLQSINDALDEQRKRVKELAAANERLNASWEYGATKALQEYLDSVQNVAKSTESLVTKAFGGMEDSLVEFVKTGKLSFTSLADSIVADITRMVVRAQITGPLAQMIMGSGGGGGAQSYGSLVGMFGNFFGGTQAPAPVTTAAVTMLPGLASGGPAQSGRLYQVNEQGPELLSYGGRDYLMMGGQGGYVKPVGGSGGTGRPMTVVNNFHLAQPADTRTQNQVAVMAGTAIQRALARNA